MKRLLGYWVIGLLGFLIIVSPVLAQQMTRGQSEKDVMIANVIAFRNKEMRVAVLQQLLNEEMNDLRQMQAVFCDQYKLDVNKFRAGGYIYDEQTGRFKEKE